MKLSSNLANSVLTAIVLIIIVWQVLADTSSDVGDSADSLAVAYNASQDCATGTNCGYTTFPLVSFFKKKGVLLLAFLAGIVLLLVKSFMGGNK